MSTILSAVPAYAADCESSRLTPQDSEISRYLHFIDFALEEQVMTVADLRRYAEGPRPINPVKNDPRATQANLRRAFDLVIARIPDELWAANRSVVLARVETLEKNSGAIEKAAEKTDLIFRSRKLESNLPAAPLGRMIAARDGRLLVIAIVDHELGYYSVLDQKFTPLINAKIIVTSDLFETGAGKILVATVKSGGLKVFDISGAAPVTVLDKSFDKLPKMKQMFDASPARVYEPLLFENASGVQVFLHPRRNTNHIYVGEKAMVATATFSVKSGTSTSEFVSTHVAKFSRSDSGSIFQAGWAKNWDAVTRSTVTHDLVVRDAGLKKTIVAGDPNVFGVAHNPDPKLVPLDNGTVGIIPETGHIRIYDVSEEADYEIDKDENYHKPSAKLFVKNGRTWIAGLSLFDVIHQEGKLVIGPAKGADKKLVSIPMASGNRPQLVDLEYHAAAEGARFLITEVSGAHYTKFHIYEDADEFLTTLPIEDGIDVRNHSFRGSAILPDGRWIAVFAGTDGKAPPLFIELRGPG